MKEERKDLIGRAALINAAHAEAKGLDELANWYRNPKGEKPKPPYDKIKTPKTKLFLMWNMGNSGGSWFENVCNLHPEVGAWEEPIRQIIEPDSPEWKKRKEWGVNKKLNMAEKKYIIFRNLDRSEKWKTIGFIKSFRPYVYEYCVKRGAVIVQMFRNPLKVVANKFEKKGTDTIKWAKRNWNVDLDLKDKDKWFEAHVARYADLYEQYLDRRDSNQLIKLEDFSKALTENLPYFKNTIEYITQTEWTNDLIQQAQKVTPYKKKNIAAYKKDKSKNALWRVWNKRQVEIFKKYFDHVMKDQNYGYE